MNTKDVSYTMSPGEILMDELEAKNVSFAEFAERLGHDAPSEEDFLSGQFQITPEIAGKIDAILSIPADFLLRLDASFRESVAVGKRVIVHPARETKRESVASGRIALRIPSSLHSRIVARAKEENISLNQLLLSFVAEGMGRIS